VNIHVYYEQKNVRLSVFDNGIGFDRDQVQQRRTSRPSLGLAGMEERAALLGGIVTVQSRPGYGTEVEALIPSHRSETGIQHEMPEVKDDHSSVSSG
jgi:signal transduction histidine kinase